jgi:hypothetical protein
MNRFPVWARCVALLVGFFATSASAAVFTVINTNDSGAGSFRQALIDANAAVGADTIAFNIPGAGVHTITLTSLLPLITSPVTIDGYTQPGSSANTNPLNAGLNTVLQIELTGTQVSLVFFTGSDGSTVRGLVINGSSQDKISSQASNLTVTGNFLSTNATGTAAASGVLSGFGVRIDPPAINAKIGGPNAADRNLISGGAAGGVILPFPQTTGHLIQGNYVGTDVTGTVALNVGTPLGLRNIGGAQVLGNLVSGNLGGGIALFDNNVVQGNLIGTQRDGTSALPNGNFGGINLQGNGSTIGGAASGQGNVIAFNINNAVDSQINLSGNRIQQNSIHSNTGLGITLLSGGLPLANDAGDADVVPGNHGQNYPVIGSVSIAAGNATISGTINSTASTALHLEFFANTACDASGYGEGQTFIGTADVTTDGSGNASFASLVFPVPVGQGVITSTATNAGGDTSEFSQCASAVGSSSTSLASSLNPSNVGQSVTFTATVTGSTPTGTVQFKDGVTSLGAPVTVNGAGVATLATSALSVATHSITAVYSGDGSNATSTSPIVSQVVNPLPAGSTTTALSSSANPSTSGQTVTFTAAVTGATPTGTVQFFDGANLLGTGAVNGAGIATLATSALSVGAHSITAVYGGDGGNVGSTSQILQQLVNPVIAPPPGSVRAIPTMSDVALLLLAALVVAFGVGGIGRFRR